MGRSRDEAGPLLGAEPGCGRGGARSCGAAGPGPPRTSLLLQAPPPGRDVNFDWQMWLRGGLYWFAVLSARRAVPGRRCRPERSKQLLTGRAGPGPGPGRTEGPARSPGPAANQVGTEQRVRPEYAGGSTDPGFEAPAQYSGGTARSVLLASVLLRTQAPQFS